MKTALTIAGSDCSGGAGVQADLKTMSALGVFGMSVIVSVVAENTARVLSIEDISPKVIADQIDAVFEDIPPDAVKVGMLSTPACMEAVAAGLKKYRPRHVVIDPVMYAKNGSPLMQESAISALRSTVLPLATLLTPNIPEAEKLAGMEISSEARRGTSCCAARTSTSSPPAASRPRTPTARAARSPAPSPPTSPAGRSCPRPCARPRNTSPAPSSTRCPWATAAGPRTTSSPSTRRTATRRETP